MKNYSCALFFLLLSINAFASPNSEMIEAKKSVQKVLDDLYKATGNFIFNKPSLILSNRKEEVASYRPRKNVIVLEMAAYRVCQSLKADSLSGLAFILGHELAHSYQEELRRRGNDTDFLSASEHKYTSEKVERQSDIQGVFSAYLAGYKTLEVVPKVIYGIYKEYNLMGRNLPGYPSYEARLNTAEEVNQQVLRLIQIYETASYLSAINEYEYAAACYKYIESYYLGHEIFLNKGVNYTLHAMNFLDRNVDPYLYPLELEWETRLSKSLIKGGVDGLQKKERSYRKKHLKLALTELVRASQLNYKCFSCDINIMCVMNLMGDHQKAINYYKDNQLSKKGKLLNVKSKERFKAHLALAIAYANMPDQNKQDKAKNIFKKLAATSNEYITYVARHNLKILNDGYDQSTLVSKASHDCPMPFRIDAIDGVRVHRSGDLKGLLIDKEKKIFCHIEVLSNSILVNFSKKQGPSFTIQRIDNSNKTNHISLDNMTDSVQVVSTSNGYFLVCKEDQTTYLIDDFTTILEWAKFHKHE